MAGGRICDAVTASTGRGDSIMSRYSEKLKKGDKVVMHTCGEADSHVGQIWICKTDQFTRGSGVYEQDFVFLEGYSGSFAPEYLQKVILPSEDERVMAALEEAEKTVAIADRNARAAIARHMENELAALNLSSTLSGKLAEAQQQYSIIQMQLNTANECAELAKQEYLAQCQANGDIRMELAEAQQTIARLESENKRLGSLIPVVKEATELMSWRDPGGGKGQKEALKLIYIWLEENPSPEYLAAQANKEGEKAK